VPPEPEADAPGPHPLRGSRGAAPGPGWSPDPAAAPVAIPLQLPSAPPPLQAPRLPELLHPHLFDAALMKTHVEADLLGLPGVLWVDVGRKHGDGRAPDPLAFRVHVVRKLPLDQLPARLRVPPWLLNYPTDVRQAEPIELVEAPVQGPLRLGDATPLGTVEAVDAVGWATPDAFGDPAAEDPDREPYDAFQGRAVLRGSDGRLRLAPIAPPPMAENRVLQQTIRMNATRPHLPVPDTAPRSARGHTLAEVRAVLDRWRDRIRAWPGVIGSDVGLKERAGRLDANEIAIRVYVARKRPAAELAPEERFPDELEGVPTDVIVQREGQLAADTAKYDPLQGGCSTGVKHPDAQNNLLSAGTLGCMVRDNTTGGLMALSCWHVWCRRYDWQSKDCTTTQPGTADGGTTAWVHDFGTVVRGVFDNSNVGPPQFGPSSLDAAVATVDKRAAKATMIQVGAITGTAAAFPGQKVRKYGRTSGLTYGVVDRTDAEIGSTITPYVGVMTSAKSYNQIGIRGTYSDYDASTFFWAQFANHGDSGSAVVDETGHVVTTVSLIYINPAAPSGGEAEYGGAGAPIAQIEAALGVTVAVEPAVVPPPDPVPVQAPIGGGTTTNTGGTTTTTGGTTSTTGGTWVYNPATNTWTLTGGTTTTTGGTTTNTGGASTTTGGTTTSGSGSTVGGGTTTNTGGTTTTTGGTTTTTGGTTTVVGGGAPTGGATAPTLAPYKDAVLVDDPIAYWDMEGSGSTYADVSGHGHHGEGLGGVTRGAKLIASGQKSASFPGTVTGPKISVPDSGDFHIDAVSVEFWMAAADAGGFNAATAPESPVVCLGTPHWEGSASTPPTEGSGVGFGVGISRTAITASTTGQSRAFGYAPNINGDLIVYVVVLLGGGTTDLYIDGVLHSSQPPLGLDTAGGLGDVLRIGGNGLQAWNFTGRLDEVALYAGRLSPARIAAHFAAGKQTVTVTNTGGTTTGSGTTTNAGGTTSSSGYAVTRQSGPHRRYVKRNDLLGLDSFDLYRDESEVRLKFMDTEGDFSLGPGRPWPGKNHPVYGTAGQGIVFDKGECVLKTTDYYGHGPVLNAYARQGKCLRFSFLWDGTHGDVLFGDESVPGASLVHWLASEGRSRCAQLKIQSDGSVWGTCWYFPPAPAGGGPPPPPVERQVVHLPPGTVIPNVWHSVGHICEVLSWPLVDGDYVYDDGRICTIHQVIMQVEINRDGQHLTNFQESAGAYHEGGPFASPGADGPGMAVRQEFCPPPKGSAAAKGWVGPPAPTLDAPRFGNGTGGIVAIDDWFYGVGDRIISVWFDDLPIVALEPLADGPHSGQTDLGTTFSFGVRPGDPDDQIGRGYAMITAHGDVDDLGWGTVTGYPYDAYNNPVEVGLPVSIRTAAGGGGQIEQAWIDEPSNWWPTYDVKFGELNYSPPASTLWSDYEFGVVGHASRVWLEWAYRTRPQALAQEGPPHCPVHLFMGSNGGLARGHRGNFSFLDPALAGEYRPDELLVGPYQDRRNETPSDTRHFFDYVGFPFPAAYPRVYTVADLAAPGPASGTVYALHSYASSWWPYPEVTSLSRSDRGGRDADVAYDYEFGWRGLSTWRIGNDWTAGRVMTSIACQPGNSETLYLGTTYGIYRNDARGQEQENGRCLSLWRKIRDDRVIQYPVHLVTLGSGEPVPGLPGWVDFARGRLRVGASGRLWWTSPVGAATIPVWPYRVHSPVPPYPVIGGPDEVQQHLSGFERYRLMTSATDSGPAAVVWESEKPFTFELGPDGEEAWVWEPTEEDGTRRVIRCTPGGHEVITLPETTFAGQEQAYQGGHVIGFNVAPSGTCVAVVSTVKDLYAHVNGPELQVNHVVGYEVDEETGRRLVDEETGLPIPIMRVDPMYEHWPCNVFRSPDRGATWQLVVPHSLWRQDQLEDVVMGIAAPMSPSQYDFDQVLGNPVTYDPNPGQEGHWGILHSMQHMGWWSMDDGRSWHRNADRSQWGYLYLGLVDLGGELSAVVWGGNECASTPGPVAPPCLFARPRSQVHFLG
jgi:hypothetical protein